MRVATASLFVLLSGCGAQVDKAAPAPLYNPPPHALFETGGEDSSASTDVPVTPNFKVRGVDVEGSTLAYDAVRNVVYAAAQASAKAYQNQLVAIDPNTATVKNAIDIGSDPASLAISDDSSTLWVSLKGAYKIRRVDVTTTPPTAGADFTIPRTADSIMELRWAGPMAVLQGGTDSVAISTHRTGVSPSYAGTLIMDNGVARPTQTRGHTGASRMTRGPAGLLFGYNNLHTGFEFFVLKVAADGVTGQDEAGDRFRDLVDGFQNDIVYGHGRVLATDGEVIDVTTPTSPTRVGKFPYKGTVYPLSAERAVMVTPANYDNKTCVLRLLDVTKFTQLVDTPLDIPDDHVWGLIPAGNGRFAFLGEKRSETPPRVYILNNPFM